MKKILKVFRVISTIIGAAILIFFFVGIFIWGLDFEPIEYERNNLVSSKNLANEGPFIFEKDSIYEIKYIQGTEENGYDVEQKQISKTGNPELSAYYYLDNSSFSFVLKDSLINEPYRYESVEKIIAISDIESKYKTLRDFLINNKVIDENLNWIFGNGHLVLNGDFIDRDYFATQVLWFIYKLEQEAEKAGGKVHFILGNHEIMNIQGNHKYAKYKYETVARVLGVKQHQLYDTTTYLGKWLKTKNIVEQIGNYTFVHAGISPEIVENKITISEMNQIARNNYAIPYYSKKDRPLKEKLILSSQTSPYWYRGYFDELEQEEIDKILNFYQTSNIIVGHTIQDEVHRLSNGKIIGIDVAQPKGYTKYFPKVESQGLLIENNKFHRINNQGKQTEI